MVKKLNYQKLFLYFYYLCERFNNKTTLESTNSSVYEEKNSETSFIYIVFVTTLCFYIHID